VFDKSVNENKESLTVALTVKEIEKGICADLFTSFCLFCCCLHCSRPCLLWLSLLLSLLLFFPFTFLRAFIRSTNQSFVYPSYLLACLSSFASAHKRDKNEWIDKLGEWDHPCVHVWEGGGSLWETKQKSERGRKETKRHTRRTAVNKNKSTRGKRCGDKIERNIRPSFMNSNSFSLRSAERQTAQKRERFRKTDTKTLRQLHGYRGFSAVREGRKRREEEFAV